MPADGDGLADVEVLKALAVIEATTVLEPPEEVVLVPLDSVTLPAPSCWKTKDVPFIDTSWVWMTVVLFSVIENFEVKAEALAHLTPFVQSHESEPVCVHVRLLWLMIELQLDPVQVSVAEKLKSASQNM